MVRPAQVVPLGAIVRGHLREGLDDVGLGPEPAAAYERLDARYNLKELGGYEELCARARSRTTFPGGGKRVETMLKGDLSSLWFFDLLLREKKLLQQGDS